MHAYERQKRWVLSTQRHVHVKAQQIEIKETNSNDQALITLHALQRESKSWKLTNSATNTLHTSLGRIEAAILSSIKRDADSQKLLNDMGTLVRQQKLRIIELEAVITATAAPAPAPTPTPTPTAETVATHPTTLNPTNLETKTTSPLNISHVTTQTNVVPVYKQSAAQALTPSRLNHRIRPVVSLLPPPPPSTSSNVLQLQAEQEAVNFWKRRCQTKDTLILRLQGIVNEQKLMIARDTNDQHDQDHTSHRGGRGSSDEEDNEENKSEDYRSRRRRRRSSGSNGSDSSSSIRRRRSDHHTLMNDHSNNPSRVLLDLPSGVFGNVELNLSWPPSNSSIDSADEDDEEVDSIDDVALSSIVEGEEGEEEEEVEEEVEEIIETGEINEDDDGNESNVSSSLDVSRSMQSDDSGMLFERYLE